MPPSSLRALLPDDWRRELSAALESASFSSLESFLVAERATAAVLPSPERVFAALHYTPFAQVRVVLLGQDPYPTRGNANGLAFSVEPGQKVPPSLRNLYKTAALDVAFRAPDHGNLEGWARRGVLLLNTVLTVREGAANSHKNRGWERFTGAVLERLKEREAGVVFLLLGKQAEQTCGAVDLSRHAVVTAPHPSPLNASNPIWNTRPFSAVNAALRGWGQPEVDWQL